jgi:hypothetical protein
MLALQLARGPMCSSPMALMLPSNWPVILAVAGLRLLLAALRLFFLLIRATPELRPGRQSARGVWRSAMAPPATGHPYRCHRTVSRLK